MSSSALRGNIAQAAGATGEAADYYLDAARPARADEFPAVAAFALSSAATTLSYQDPIAARHHASEAVALARQTGAPMAIVASLLGLAQALVTSEPDQVHALLTEALQLETTPDYESPGELQIAVFAATGLEEWPTTLRVAGRVLHHHARSGMLPSTYSPRS